MKNKIQVLAFYYFKNTVIGKKIIKKINLAIFTFLLFLPFKQVFADGLTISPPKFEFNAKPGQILLDTIKITNKNNTPLELFVTVQDFVAKDETGTPTFINPQENNSDLSMANWISMEGQKESITLKPNEKKEIPFKIEVPSNAEPGGHYGSIFFSPPSPKGQVSVVQKIGSLVLVRVEGKIQEKGKLNQFFTYKDLLSENKNKAIDQIKKISFFQNFPINFAIRFENTGNVHTKVYGKIEIERYNKKLKNIGLKTVLKNGVPFEQKIVDFIPINDEKGNTLAKSFRRFDVSYQGEAFWYHHDDGNKEIRYKGFPIGKYKAKLTLSYGSGKENLTKEINFIIFPWKKITLWILLIIIGLFSLIYYRKWSRKKLEKRLRHMIEQEKKEQA